MGLLSASKPATNTILWSDLDSSTVHVNKETKTRVQFAGIQRGIIFIISIDELKKLRNKEKNQCAQLCQLVIQKHFDEDSPRMWNTYLVY
jgi:hypothetical protein